MWTWLRDCRAGTGLLLLPSSLQDLSKCHEFRRRCRLLFIPQSLHGECAALCNCYASNMIGKKHWRLFRNVFKLGVQHLLSCLYWAAILVRTIGKPSLLKAPTKFIGTIGGFPSTIFGLGQSRIQDNECEWDGGVIYCTAATVTGPSRIYINS